MEPVTRTLPLAPSDSALLRTPGEPARLPPLRPADRPRRQRLPVLRPAPRRRGTDRRATPPMGRPAAVWGGSPSRSPPRALALAGCGDDDDDDRRPAPRPRHGSTSSTSSDDHDTPRRTTTTSTATVGRHQRRGATTTSEERHADGLERQRAAGGQRAAGRVRGAVREEPRVLRASARDARSAFRDEVGPVEEPGRRGTCSRSSSTVPTRLVRPAALRQVLLALAALLRAAGRQMSSLRRGRARSSAPRSGS